MRDPSPIPTENNSDPSPIHPDKKLSAGVLMRS